MTIVYPLTFPLPRVAAVRLRPVSAAGVTRSPFTFQEQLQDWGGEMWEMEIDTGSVGYDAGRRLAGFVAALRGRIGTFLMGDPAARLMGSGAGAPVVDGANQQGAVLTTKGWSASAAGVLRRGDYLQLGSGGAARLHMVLADIDAGADGKAQVPIFPRLRESPADEQAIVISDPVGVWRLRDGIEPWEVTPPVLYRFTLLCREAL